MISIFALIYRSTAYADSLMDSLLATTPELDDGTAEFFFLANNATPKVINHLRRKKYPFRSRTGVIPKTSPPEIHRCDQYDYIIDVYKGWNAGIENAAGDVIVPVNSDHVFAPGWLTELMKVWTPGKVVSPVMMEPNEIRFSKKNGTGSLHCEAGRHPKEFDLDLFRSKCQEHSSSQRTKGGVYMPCMMLKQAVIDMGMFAPGNLVCSKGIFVASGYPADMDLFAKLQKAGIDHETCWKSFCYHFMEGEMRE